MSGDPKIPAGGPASFGGASTGTFTGDEPETESLSFEAFYGQEYRAVLALSRVLTGDLSRAEDVTHGSFAAALESWEAIDDPAVWIRSVMADKVRSKRRVRYAEQRTIDEQPHTMRVGPDLPAETEEFWAAVRGLPRRQAQSVALFHLEDRSVADLSAILACSESTARTHLMRGRRTLTRKLEIRPAIDIDTYGRRHGEIVKESLEHLNPPPIDGLGGWSSKSPNRRPWIAALVATAGIAVFGVLAFSGGIGERTEPETQPFPTNRTPASTPIPETARVPVAPKPFDMRSFMASRLDEVFGDFGSEVAVVALVQNHWLFEFEKTALSAPMLEMAGYRVVPAEHVAEVAAAFATQRGTEALEGTWSAVGLEPKYFDSPVDTWIDDLAAAPGTVLFGVDRQVGTSKVPEGWEVVADLELDIPVNALVVGTDEGMAVISATATRFIRPDGTWLEGQPPPSEGQLGAYFSYLEMMSAGHVVVTVTGYGTTWMFDTSDLTWREIGRYPLQGIWYTLGSAVVDGQFVLVMRDSLVFSLDLESGVWTERDPLPDGIDVGGVTTDGSTIYVAGVMQDDRNWIIGSRFPRVFASTTDGGWTELPEIPIDGQASSIGWVDGFGLVAVNYESQSAVLDDTSGEWRLIDDVPIPFGECYPQMRPVARGVVAVCWTLAWFDPDTEAWTGIRPTFNGKYAVLSDQILGLVKTDHGTTQLVSRPLSP